MTYYFLFTVVFTVLCLYLVDWCIVGAIEELNLQGLMEEIEREVVEAGFSLDDPAVLEEDGEVM